VFNRENVLRETIAWTARCVSGRGRRIPANLFGALVATKEEPRKIIFVARKFARRIDLEDSNVRREPGFLSENLILSASGKGPSYLFVFPRSDAAVVEQIVHDLQETQPVLQEEGTAASSPAG